MVCLDRPGQSNFARVKQAASTWLGLVANNKPQMMAGVVCGINKQVRLKRQCTDHKGAGPVKQGRS
jgi:hypothetical protein